MPGPRTGSRDTLAQDEFPLFAVCIALAVGIALGAGPFAGSSADGDTDDPTMQRSRSRSQALEADQVFADAVTAAASTRRGSKAV